MENEQYCDRNYCLNYESCYECPISKLFVCNSVICDLSGEKREIGPCQFLKIDENGQEDCCPY
jgi:hypothetical protein